MSALSPDWASVGLGWVGWGALGRSCEAAGWVKEPAAGSGSAELEPRLAGRPWPGPSLCFAFLSYLGEITSCHILQGTPDPLPGLPPSAGECSWGRE